MEESQGGKLSRKLKDTPFMGFGILGFVGALAYGAYKYNRRGTMSRSLFFVQLRVAAQGMVVGALCLGVIGTVSKKIYEHTFTSKEH